VHPELGLGPKVIDNGRGIEYPSMARNAIAMKAERELLSEELRLLYVAATRAKERLIMTAVNSNPHKRMEEYSLLLRGRPIPELMRDASSMSSWLMMACAVDGGETLSLSYVSPDELMCEEKENGETEVSLLPDAELCGQIKSAVEYVYPHADAAALPSKITATELKHYAEPDAEARALIPTGRGRFRVPDFGKSEKALSGAEKGTATHIVLQYIDYAACGSRESITAEADRLLAQSYITERQRAAVDTDALYGLFSSPLGERIRRADSVRREFKFSLLCSAEELLGGGGSEQLLLQGVIDCFLEENGEIVIIDYKTDRVSGAALLERAELYSPQVRAYASALGRITGKRVKECVLFFLAAGECVSVDF